MIGEVAKQSVIQGRLSMKTAARPILEGATEQSVYNDEDDPLEEEQWQKSKGSPNSNEFRNSARYPLGPLLFRVCGALLFSSGGTELHDLLISPFLSSKSRAFTKNGESSWPCNREGGELGRHRRADGRGAA